MTYTKEREDFFNPQSAEVRAPGNARKPIKVGFKRLTPSAVIPTKAHATDSGFDLVAAEDVIIAPGETVVVKTGITVDLPAGYEAQVRPRSGVTAKTKIRVQLGTIDNGYTGEIGVIVDNIAMPSLYINETYNTIGINFVYAPLLLTGVRKQEGGSTEQEYTYLIRKGDRIAQLVIQRLPNVVAFEVEDVGNSERGANGFGSTGVNTYEDSRGNTNCCNCGAKVEGGYCNCQLAFNFEKGTIE